jgi:hypothetical protein
MAISELASTGAKAAGATAGVGAGGGLSYAFFQEANGANLIALGNAYGLTAFAFIALILLIGAYITLPASASDQTRKAISRILAVFAVLSIGGFLYQLLIQQQHPTITINATFEPQLARLNNAYHLQKDLELKAELRDSHGNRIVFADDKDITIKNVGDGAELTIQLDALPDALQHTIENKVASASCAASNGCNLSIDGNKGDNHGP